MSKFWNDDFGVTHVTEKDMRMANLFHYDPERWAYLSILDGWDILRDPDTNEVLGRYSQLTFDDIEEMARAQAAQ